jgi:hypothetical protein
LHACINIFETKNLVRRVALFCIRVFQPQCYWSFGLSRNFFAIGSSLVHCRCSLPSLTSIHWLLVIPLPPTSYKQPKHCQCPLGRGRGGKSMQMGTSASLFWKSSSLNQYKTSGFLHLLLSPVCCNVIIIIIIFWWYWGLNSGPCTCYHLSYVSSPFWFTYFFE